MTTIYFSECKEGALGQMSKMYFNIIKKEEMKDYLTECC